MIELIQIAFMNVFAKMLQFLFEIGTSYFMTKEAYEEFALILSYIIIYTKIVTLDIPNLAKSKE